MGRRRNGRRNTAPKVKPTKEEVKAVMEEVEELDLPEGAHWMLIHERLGLEYGDVFEYFTDDPEFFGMTEVEAPQ